MILNLFLWRVGEMKINSLIKAGRGTYADELVEEKCLSRRLSNAQKIYSFL